MKKLISLILFMAAGLYALAACGEEAVRTTELAGWQEYTILRSDSADDASVEAAKNLSQAIEEKLGVKLTLATDWVKRGEEPPTGTKEILVGNTNRPESDTQLAYLDYIIKFENNRVVINGGSADAVLAGVDWFIETCIGETLLVPEETYVHHEIYPYADITAGGVLLSEYAIEPNEPYDWYIDIFRVWMAKATGAYPGNSGAHRILFRKNPELPVNKVSMSVQGGNILLETSSDTNGMIEAMEMFKRELGECDGTELTLSGEVEITGEQLAFASAEQIADWRKLTDARIEEIRNSPNMEIGAKKLTYYISPNGNDNNNGTSPKTAWKTIDKLNTAKIPPYCTVRFERGGIYRGKFTAVKGVTYTAYGEGAKPEIWGSPFNGAEVGSWEEVAENVWRYSEKFNDDVGTLVMNHGEAFAWKIATQITDITMYNAKTGEEFLGYESLDENYEFWHDLGGKVTTNPAGGYLYLYCDRGNPSEVWDSIEFNTRGNIITLPSHTNDVVIDNLCVKYGGSHGVGAGTVYDLTVRNCEFGWIGGSLQYYINSDPIRFGNAVEIYGATKNFTVTDNYIYQVYDAGITQQTKVGDSDRVNTSLVLNHINVTYARNVIEYCNYSIEYFLSGVHEDNPSHIDNFLIEDNISWYAGEGFCEQRPNRGYGSHIKSGGACNRASNYFVKNNLFIGNAELIVYIASTLYNDDGSDSIPEFSGNNFVGKTGHFWGITKMNTQGKANYDMTLLDYIGEHTDGTDTFWFTAGWH